MRRHLVSARLLLLALPLAFPVSSVAQSEPDIHTTIDSARDLYQSSSWAHGYIHGYEEGFHLGDVDLQLAKAARDPEKEGGDKFRMRREYGDQKTFKKGYKHGLLVGYADAYSGREFRAFREMRKLAEGLQRPSPDNSGKISDTALEDGYRKGLTAGLTDARARRAFRPSVHGDQCEQEAGYCAFHDRGLELGYSDGYWNQRVPSELRTARK